jgi:hypothetical protein
VFPRPHLALLFPRQEWRIFGSNFPHLRTSNTVVKVEAYSSAAQEPNVRLLKWSFGKSLDADELRFGYVIRFAHEPTSEQTRLDWQYGGESCQGVYNSVTRTAVLNFFLRTSTVTITYRVLDADSMACTIVEVDESSAPTIQYGHMYV